MNNELDLSFIFTALGVGVSTLFGMWGIYLALRKSKYPASLTFVRDQALGLFDDVTGKIPNLRISYKEKDIDHSVMFINGYIVNDGSKDISPEMVENKLSANISTDYEWLECVITSKPKDLIVKSKVQKPQILEFDFGLFRRNEYFSFQALALSKNKDSQPKAKDFELGVNWKHRIANLGNIKKIQIPSEPRKKKLRWVAKTFSVVAGLSYILIGLSMLSGYDLLNMNTEIHYMVNNNGKYEEATIKPTSNKKATINFLTSGNKKNVILNKYGKENILYPIIAKREKSIYFVIIFGLLTIGGGLLMFFVAFEKDYKRRRINRLIQNSN